MANEIEKVSPFEISTFEQAERFAKMLAESDFAPKDYKGKPGNVLIAMQFGHELGLKAMQAIQNIAVVNGRPQIWGDAALALVIGNPQCGGVREWTEGTIKGGNAIAYCEVKRGGEITKREFSVVQATQAGLINSNVWAKYPERMLQMRARGFALRDAFPDVLKGIYIEGELDGITEAVVETKASSKLGIQAVKQAVTQSVNAMADEVKQETEALNINPETGEINPPSPPPNMPTFDEIKIKLQNAKNIDQLTEAASVVSDMQLVEEKHTELKTLYRKKLKEIKTPVAEPKHD